MTIPNRSTLPLVSAAVLLLLLLLPPSVQAQFTFSDFSDVSSLSLNGTATPALTPAVLRLTPAVNRYPYLAGSAWYATPQLVANGFETTFTFQITGSGGSYCGPGGGGDGLTFTVQNDGPTALRGAGGHLGYSGMPNSVTVEFDTCYNGWDPPGNGNHIGISLGSVSSAVTVTPSAILKSGAEYDVRIVYEAGMLHVYFQDLSGPPILSHPVDLPGVLGAGSAYVGFTSAIAASWSNHDVLDWSFTPTADADEDGDDVPDGDDNCPGTAPGDAVDANGCADAQVDGDGDGFCDPGASGGPSVCTGTDAFPEDPDEWNDNDGDGIGDNADPDDDDDGQTDDDEAACGSNPLDFGSTAPDLDEDNIPDCVDPDDDGDGIPDGDDNCPVDANADQADHDGDGAGDACDPDDDNDGIPDDDDAFPFDADNDGVPDGDDLCDGTVIPEGVPTVRLKPNRWALTDDDLLFDTVKKGKGGGSGRSYTTTDTGGCSCEQIIDAMDLGNGHTKHGCSGGAMDEWMAVVQGVSARSTEAEARALETPVEVPAAFALEAAYPNPFNPQTTLRFSVPETAPVRLVVFDVLGRQVLVLADGTHAAGTHEVVFEAGTLPSGTYLALFVTPAGSFVQTMQLVK